MPVAVLTGGASGLGLALGGRCAALGIDVALLDVDGEAFRLSRSASPESQPRQAAAGAEL